MGGARPAADARAMYAVAYAGQIMSPWRHARDDALADALDLGLASQERFPCARDGERTKVYLDALALIIVDHVAGECRAEPAGGYLLVPLDRRP